MAAVAALTSCAESRQMPLRVGTGWRLCRCSRSRSLSVRAQWKQEVLWASAPVAEVRPAAEQLFHIVLDIAKNPELIRGHTRAGQFVQVKIGNSKPAFLAIASPPATSAKGYFEFLVKDVEGTTAEILCDMGKGDEVEMSQVMGNGFNVDRIYPLEKVSTVLLFATGSGISPIRSLLDSGLQANQRSEVTLYYGARNLGRMAYQEKFKEWEASGVTIVPVLSQPDLSWTGESGYVQAAFSKSKDNIKGSEAGAFLSGHKQMTQDVSEILSSVGVPKGNILLNF